MSILCQETVSGHGPSGMDCIVVMVMVMMMMMMVMMMTAVWSHSVHTLPRDCIWTWSVRYGLYSYHGDDDDDDDDDCILEPVSVLCQETVPGHGLSGMDCIVIMVMVMTAF